MALNEHEQRTLVELAELCLTGASERIEYAPRQLACGAVARRIREGIAQADVLAAVYESVERGELDLEAAGVRGWLCQQRAELLYVLREDRDVLHDVLAGGERADNLSVAEVWRTVDADLEQLEVVSRLLRVPPAAG